MFKPFLTKRTKICKQSLYLDFKVSSLYFAYSHPSMYYQIQPLLYCFAFYLFHHIHFFHDLFLISSEAIAMTARIQLHGVWGGPMCSTAVTTSLHQCLSQHPYTSVCHNILTPVSVTTSLHQCLSQHPYTSVCHNILTPVSVTTSLHQCLSQHPYTSVCHNILTPVSVTTSLHQCLSQHPYTSVCHNILTPVQWPPHVVVVCLLFVCLLFFVFGVTPPELTGIYWFLRTCRCIPPT